MTGTFPQDGQDPLCVEFYPSSDFVEYLCGSQTGRQPYFTDGTFAGSDGQDDPFDRFGPGGEVLAPRVFLHEDEGDAPTQGYQQPPRVTYPQYEVQDRVKHESLLDLDVLETSPQKQQHSPSQFSSLSELEGNPEGDTGGRHTPQFVPGKLQPVREATQPHHELQYMQEDDPQPLHFPDDDTQPDPQPLLYPDDDPERNPQPLHFPENTTDHPKQFAPQLHYLDQGPTHHKRPRQHQLGPKHHKRPHHKRPHNKQQPAPVYQTYVNTSTHQSLAPQHTTPPQEIVLRLWGELVQVEARRKELYELLVRYKQLHPPGFMDVFNSKEYLCLRELLNKEK